MGAGEAVLKFEPERRARLDSSNNYDNNTNTIPRAAALYL